VPIVRTLNPNPPTGWKLDKALFATPTIVLFENGKEVSRYTGYNGDKQRFWKWLGFRLLTPEQRHIAFEEGTEPAGTSALNGEKRRGIYTCAGCNLPLFTSEMKYDSGTGWPSFFTTIPGAFRTKTDYKLLYPRTEYHCARCGGHHGHVFDDGPPPTRERWCNNGVALRFLPAGT